MYHKCCGIALAARKVRGSAHGTRYYSTLIIESSAVVGSLSLQQHLCKYWGLALVSMCVCAYLLRVESATNTPRESLCLCVIKLYIQAHRRRQGNQSSGRVLIYICVCFVLQFPILAIFARRVVRYPFDTFWRVCAM
jgi:hypothetical protein